MMSGMENPAKELIAKLGRHDLAQACGVDISQTYKWTYPKARGGTGGMIPARNFAAIRKLAEQKGVEIDPALLVGWH